MTGWACQHLDEFFSHAILPLSVLIADGCDSLLRLSPLPQQKSQHTGVDERIGQDLQAVRDAHLRRKPIALKHIEATHEDKQRATKMDETLAPGSPPENEDGQTGDQEEQAAQRLCGQDLSPTRQHQPGHLLPGQ